MCLLKKLFSKIAANLQGCLVLLLAFFFLLCLQNDVSAQYVTGYQYHKYGGYSAPINGTGLVQAYGVDNGKFHNDDWISLKVRDGYVCRIYRHYHGEQEQENRQRHNYLDVVGNVSDLNGTWMENRARWQDEISSLKITQLPSNYRSSDNLVSGIYYFYNPYKNTYLRSGKGAGTDNSVETHNDNFNFNSQNKPYSDEYKFVLIRNEKGHFYIFNASSGKALMPEGAASSSYELQPNHKLSSEEFGGQVEWASYVLTGLGLNRYTICPKGNQRIAITMGWEHDGPLTFEVNDKEAQQQFVPILVKQLDDLPLPPKVDEDAPAADKYDLLSFAGGEASPHKKNIG